MRKVLFILSELADADLDWMVDNGMRQTYGRGSVLIEEGKPITAIFVLLDGQLSVSIGGAQRQTEVARLQPGEVLGELSFLDSRPPSATVTALSEVTVLAIPRDRLGAKLEEDAAFSARFHRALGVFLAARLRRTMQRFGYSDEEVLDDDVAHQDELDPELLDQVGLAGARFAWMMKRLRSARRELPPDPTGEGNARR